MDDVVRDFFRRHEVYGGETPPPSDQEYEDGYEGTNHPHSFGFPENGTVDTETDPVDTETDPRVTSQTQYGNQYAEGSVPEEGSDPAEALDFFFEEETEDDQETEIVPDGGVVSEVQETDTPYNPTYEVQPNQQHWWDDASGVEDFEDEEVYRLLDEAGVSYVTDHSPLEPGAALDAEELEAIEEVVKESYPGDSEQFADDVALSEVHPQYSKQMERFFESDTVVPTTFSDYDGFPMPDW